MTRLLRLLCYRALAMLSLALALVGVVLPGLPTVPFVLLAAFAAARGWPRLEHYLLGHPTFGRFIQQWRAAGVVPRTAKYAASGMMLASLCVLWLSLLPLLFKAAVTLLLLLVAIWLWRRPEISSSFHQ